MDDALENEIEYYTNLDWTLIHGTDLDFNGNPYHYIEIKELPSFAYCAKTQEICLANYKTQLKLIIQVMLENKQEIPIPGEDEDDIDWESLCP
jgi:predicted RNase H-like HicB family nuclease